MATILIADDCEANRGVLKALLGYSNHLVLEASDGALALVLARIEHPDLIIADILMPTMDGYEFIRRVRAEPAIAHTPVIFFTGTYLEREDCALAEACGVKYVLSKPCGNQLILDTIGEALGDPAHAVIAPIQDFHEAHRRLINDKLVLKVTELEKANQRLIALIEVGTRIASERDQENLLAAYCCAARDLVGAQYAALGVLGSDGQTLRYFITMGMDGSMKGRFAALPAHGGLPGSLITEKQPLRLTNSNGDAGLPDLPCGVQPASSFLGVRLNSPTQVYGWLCMIDKVGSAEFSEEDGRLATTLAGQAAIAVENAALLEDLRLSNNGLAEAYDTTIEGWSRALDLRDKETEGHSQRVTELALRMVHKMGIDDEQCVHIRRGALLHDIGKMGVPDSILLKPGSLTEEEWIVMRKHPVQSYELLSPISFLKPALDIPYCHHEKWDGTGYPRGLKGEEIPLAARIFAVADVWDAMRSKRPYRAAWPEEAVCEHIQSLSGTHFDPQVVEAFLDLEPDFPVSWVLRPLSEQGV